MANPSEPSAQVQRVLFAASEIDPLVKVGGLGDVAGSLPQAIQALDPASFQGTSFDIRVVVPLHTPIRETVSQSEPVVSFWIPRAGGSQFVQVYQIELNGVQVYLVDGQPISAAKGIYDPDPEVDGEKYTFFSLAALELGHQLGWRPDVIHANDWHTALIPYLLELKKPYDHFFAGCRSVLTIHNLPFMGAHSEDALEAYGVPRSTEPKLPLWARYLPLPLGLQSSDAVIAVSPTYAQEILTPEFGHGLQDLLLSRRESVSGILNGLDTLHWDPQNDQGIPAAFSYQNLDARQANKKALLESLSLEYIRQVPLLIFIGRMDQQKGVDLAIEALRSLRQVRWQAIFLGTGNPQLEDACRKLEKDYPKQVRAITRFDGALARNMYAGADLLLMPSRYEPCGLAQMIAMRYGCIPLARATGGLRDTIHDRLNSNKNTGFLFEKPSASDMAKTIQRALKQFADDLQWMPMQVRGMLQDFSWQNSAAQYANVYLSHKEQT
ncbi:MAG: glycogen/starch synthase [Anaerolineaceae bacterium]|nr:glycogen/starch synthase [Anaerolineaceae bacterium]